MSTVPSLLRPLVWFYWLAWSPVLFGLHWFLSHTCRIEWHGFDCFDRRPNFVFCGWHSVSVPYLVALQRFDRPVVQLINTHWFIFPVNWLLQKMGAGRLIPAYRNGTSDVSLDQVVGLLQAGYSTHITPDAPRGPCRRLRRGVLELSRRSGVPIVPITTESSCAWTWSWTWDKKRVPAPFSKIIVRLGTPIVVTDESYEEARAALLAALG